MINIVLYRPEIPPNTGNIARQCVGMNAFLHIIGPVGFDMSDSSVKRAGLDYWDDLKLKVHENTAAFLEWLGDREPWLVTKFGMVRYDAPEYTDGDIILFGNEIKGLPREWLERWAGRTVYIPMPGKIRNYNLANTVSIILAHSSLKAGIYGGVGN
jgi:tRNA (cytidine/uridine-2'-O-)-methyltransferase